MTRDRCVQGLSLVEVLVALSILALSLLALVPMFSLGIRENASANQLGVANSLAREKLEQLTCFPSTDPRLAVELGRSTKAFDRNDLPAYYNPSTGETSPPVTFPTPPAGWFPYPFSRTYTVTAFTAVDATHIATVVNASTPDESVYNVAIPPPSPYYNLKLVTVTVASTRGAGRSVLLPGRRRTVQSAYVRYRNALTN